MPSFAVTVGPVQPLMLYILSKVKQVIFNEFLHCLCHNASSSSTCSYNASNNNIYWSSAVTVKCGITTMPQVIKIHDVPLRLVVPCSQYYRFCITFSWQ